MRTIACESGKQDGQSFTIGQSPAYTIRRKFRGDALTGRRCITFGDSAIILESIGVFLCGQRNSNAFLSMANQDVGIRVLLEIQCLMGETAISKIISI
jgi:hypothetical protein